MEKIKQIFSQSKEGEGASETISSKETEDGPVRPLESSSLFPEGPGAVKRGHDSGPDDPGAKNEQPAKDILHRSLDENPDHHPFVTTTTTSTHSGQKDVSSTATINPFTETYTTTTTYKKSDT